MTLWLDRRAEIPPGTPTTNALVIGVSFYDHLPTKEAGPSEDPLKFKLVQASTPAVGAFRFAKWLRDRFHNPHAPLRTVHLFLSPSEAEKAADPELAALSEQVDPALTDRVRPALFEWREACMGSPHGMAIFYASGHGVAVSKENSNVLLQDFAADPLVMSYSVDVGLVHRGMADPTLAQNQFYFVDACRIRPEAFTRCRDAGHGLGLREEWAGRDSRAAPIFFSASPDTPALGEPGNGTIFSQALMDCLDGPGVDNRADEQGRFRITSYSLHQALDDRVAHLAIQHEEAQDVVGGGQWRLADLHYFEVPPDFPLCLLIDPDHAKSVAWASIWDSNRERRLIEDGPFELNPTTWMLPIGVYSLDVSIRPDTPPLQTKEGLAVVVEHTRHQMPKRVKLI